MSSKCSACSSSILKKEEICCSACTEKFHYACLRISDDNFKKMSVKYKESYICPNCAQKTSPSAEYTNKNCTEIQIENLENILDKKLTDFKNNIIAELKQTVLMEIKNNLTTLSSELLNLATSHNTLQSEHEKLIAEHNNLKTQVSKLEDSVSELTCQFSKQQQWVRQQNIEIIGVPELNNEDIPGIIIKIAKHAGVSLHHHDIEFTNRITPRQNIKDRPRVIVCKLKNRLLKDSIISGLKKTRGITSQDIDISGRINRIFVNDHLTPQNRYLLKKSKQLATEKAYKFVWSKNCSIFVRKNEVTHAIVINSEKDLLKIV